MNETKEKVLIYRNKEVNTTGNWKIIVIEKDIKKEIYLKVEITYVIQVKIKKYEWLFFYTWETKTITKWVLEDFLTYVEITINKCNLEEN